ncbi:MAG TPA: hydrogenase maturation protease [Acidimicrobiales bacterium]|nr:hydrogenase maturation protease [Acidimicrobiales bacterium]
MTRRVLVAGIGNIFLGDDGFGVEVANRLASHPQPEGVRVADYGLRGVHLAYELLDGYDVLVLVDAVPMGEAPGTVAVIEPDVPEPVDAGDDVAPVVEAHSMSPGVVLGMLAGLGARVGRIVVVGCEPADVGEGIGLSEPVAAAVGPAVELCREVLAEMVQPLDESLGKEARR